MFIDLARRGLLIAYNGNTIEEREFEKKYRDLCKSLKHKLPID